MNSTPIVSIENLSFAYPGMQTVLKDISFTIASGSITMLIGPNGSGKTTLLNIMAGLLEPTDGDVAVLDCLPREVVNQVGYVPQRLSIESTFPMTVGEFLQYSHSQVSTDDIISLLEQLNIMSLKESGLGKLSGGQLQRVLIARALLGRPKLLLLDEPVSGVDIGGEQSFYELIKHIRAKYDVTVVLVSHEVDIVSSVATHVVCINQTMLCQGEPEQVLTSEVIEGLYGKHSTWYKHH